MPRSQLTIDLNAFRANVARLLGAAGGAELWAVVKADAYGHGARDCGPAALAAGATALCVATVEEALALRIRLPDARLIVLGPAGDVAGARDAGLELVVGAGPIPDGVRVHVKLDTGMGRWGLSELPAPSRAIVGAMTHLATADSDPAFARRQIERFRDATGGLAGVTRHVANSAATLRLPEARFDAVRCGIALYGISPFGEDPAADGLRPVLSWRSEVALVRPLRAGESTGYGRRFVAERDTWIGIVPVGYADGFRRDLTGTEVLVDGARRRVVGAISMDALAVELDGAVEHGAPVTLVGDGVLFEDHARIAGTIAYELACGVNRSATRAERAIIGA